MSSDSIQQNNRLNGGKLICCEWNITLICWCVWLESSLYSLRAKCFCWRPYQNRQDIEFVRTLKICKVEFWKNVLGGVRIIWHLKCKVVCRCDLFTFYSQERLSKRINNMYRPHCSKWICISTINCNQFCLWQYSEQHLLQIFIVLEVIYFLYKRVIMIYFVMYFSCVIIQHNSL